MKREPLFALTHDWWTWDHPRVRSALRTAALEHWLDAVESAFAENARRRRGPSTWAGLCGEGLIRRDAHHLSKLRRGDHDCSDPVLLGLSTALGVPVRELLPTTEDWLVNAACELCGGDADAADARQYVRERLRRSDPAATPLRANGHRTPDADAAVRRVAGILDPLLAAIDAELSERNQRHERTHQPRPGTLRLGAREPGTGR